MTDYTEAVMARRALLRPDGRPVYNCCQAVVSVFAQDLGYDEEKSLKAAALFRGGMQMGSVCGAVTGALMVLGLAGLSGPDVTEGLYQRLKERHEGCLNCADLLRASAQRGEVKKVFCDGLIRECVQYVQDALRAEGRL